MRPRPFALFIVFAVLASIPPHLRGLDKVSPDQYRAHLEKLRGLLQSCEISAAACDAKAVGNDEQVQLQGLGVGANTNSFEAHYDWTRDALTSAKNAGGKDRKEKLSTTESRLDEALRDLPGGKAAQADIDISAARRRADAILGHPEFATVREDSIWDRVVAHIYRWLDRFFNGVAQFGQRSPWIGPVIEWGLIGIALIGLALWAMRVLQRQRLAVRVEAARQIEPWEEASRNWRAMAEQEASRGDWREAVHCLYWASIAMLEGRKLWSANRSRTPREYVRLLEAGSARWKLLRQQTLGFEHVWYGLNDAAREDYESALEMHEALRAT